MEGITVATGSSAVPNEQPATPATHKNTRAPRAPRKPRAAKPARKQRMAAPFTLFSKTQHGNWTPLMELSVTASYETALKELKKLPTGTYMIARNYGVKNVEVTQVPKVIVT